MFLLAVFHSHIRLKDRFLRSQFAQCLSSSLLTLVLFCGRIGFLFGVLVSKSLTTLLLGLLCLRLNYLLFSLRSDFVALGTVVLEPQMVALVLKAGNRSAIQFMIHNPKLLIRNM